MKFARQAIAHPIFCQSSRESVAPGRDPEESYLYQDTFTTTHGKHSLKFGGSYLRYRSNNYDTGPISGAFQFNNLETSLPGFTTTTGHPFASFLMGAAHSASDGIYRTEPGYRQAVLSFFAQDDWRATSKLTLNLGVRWEIPHAQDGSLQPHVPIRSHGGEPAAQRCDDSRRHGLAGPLFRLRSRQLLPELLLQGICAALRCGVPSQQ